MRNTAIQRLPDGVIQLTPLYDFAPMFMDDEIIARRFHWRNVRGLQYTWSEVIETLQVNDEEREKIACVLRKFSDYVGRLPTLAKDCGVQEVVLSQCLKSIETQSEQLLKLPI